MTKLETNNRQIELKMIKDVKPLNVSPVIKTARWSLLLLGCLYGMRRKHSLTLFEEKVYKERQRLYEEKVKRVSEEYERNDRISIRTICEDLGLTDLIPPEYRD